MKIRCIISGHMWDGCVCRHCGKVRDEQHDWDGCSCKKCYRRRDEQHDWDGCICRRCKAHRDEDHDYVRRRESCDFCENPGRNIPDWHPDYGGTCFCKDYFECKKCGKTTYEK